MYFFDTIHEFPRGAFSLLYVIIVLRRFWKIEKGSDLHSGVYCPAGYRGIFDPAAKREAYSLLQG
jgi:hypothetical protein